MTTLTTSRPRNLWRWIAAIAVLVLVGASGWIAGARLGQPQAAAGQSSTGFDIGTATKPTPTGTLREFQLVAKEAPGRSRPA